jgi:hypothetical protein
MLVASAIAGSSSLHRRQHLHASIFGQREHLPAGARDDLTIDGHRDASRLRRDAEALEHG